MSSVNALNPRALTDSELAKYADLALLEDQMNKIPWSPIQLELLRRVREHLDDGR